VRKVVHVCDGGIPRWRVRYFATVACAMWMPSFRSSPWTRCAPQRVGGVHLPDQCVHDGGQGGPAGSSRRGEGRDARASHVHGCSRRRLAKSRDWTLTTVWALSMDAVAAGLIVMVLRSHVMWFRLRAKRLGGVVALALGFLSCGAFISALRWLLLMASGDGLLDEGRH
jgi:hypothetical protein